MEDDRTKLTEVVYKNLSIDKNEQKLLRVDSASEKKSSWFLYASAIVVNLFIFSLASGFSWTSSAVQMLQSNDPTINPLRTPVTPVQESWIASLYSLGAAAGPLIAGKLADTLGRKKTLLVISIPKLICLLALCFTTDIKIYYATRFIMGLVLGTAFAITPLYLAEISEVHNRGTVSSTMGIAMNTGVVYCLILGPVFSIKMLTFLCAIPLSLFIIFFGLFIPETPVFLVSVGKGKKAIQALQQLRGTVNVQQELQEISKTLERLKSDKKGAIDLIKDNGLRKALIVTVGLVFALQFSGINPIIGFLETIIEESGSEIPVYLSTNLVGSIQVLGSLVTCVIVGKFGRKVLLMASVASILVSHVTVALYFYIKGAKHYNLDHLLWLPVACLLFYMFTFNLGLSSIPFIVMGEIFPHSVKAIGASVATGCCFLFSFIITLAFRIIMDEYGLAACYLLLSGSMLAILFFIYFVVPETKDKTEAEIQQLLKK